MEAEMVPSLSPLVQGADQWGEMLLLLPLLVALEAVLSADNAIALAAISRRLHDPARQRQALNLGLLLALVFRLGLIAAARWVLHFPPLQLLASGYLLVLFGRHLLGFDNDDDSDNADEVSAEARQNGDGLSAAGTGPAAAEPAEPPAAGENGALPISDGIAGGINAGPTAPASPPPGSRHGHSAGLTSVVLTLALTDLAFSLDSVAAAVAVTDRMLLVMAGGVIGIIALRLTAELFIRWLEVYSRLETAGYLAVGLVGLRLLLRVLQPDLDLPDWSLLASVALLFLWGFSRRLTPPEEA